MLEVLNYKKSVPLYIFRELFVNLVGYKLGLRKLRYKGRINNITWDIQNDVQDKGLKHYNYINSVLAEFDKDNHIEKDTFLEMGPGGTILSGLYLTTNGWKKYIGVDTFPSLVWSEYPSSVYSSAIEGMNPNSKKIAQQHIDRSKRGGGPIYYLGNDGLSNSNLRKLANNKVDLIYSYGVLEHVPNPKEVFKKNYSLIKNNGLVVHIIDPHPHTWMRFSNPYCFLTIPDWLWNLMYAGRGFINRYAASNYLNWAKEAGFEILSQKTELSDKKYLSLKNKFLKRFRGLAEEDLLTHRLYLILRKKAA